jgi:redox-sensing transcriptional repressor
MMTTKIPTPTIERLCSIYHILEQLEENKTDAVSSVELGKQLGINANSIRKDISFIGDIGNCRAGYSVSKLKSHLIEKLKLNRKKATCIIGLGKLGATLLNNERLLESGFGIIAGFDSNINKIETIQTKVPLYPANEITMIVKREKIEIGILAVPPQAAVESAKRLVAGGIRGIVNFSSAIIKPTQGVCVRNVDLVGEIRIVSAMSMILKETVS